MSLARSSVSTSRGPSHGPHCYGQWRRVIIATLSLSVLLLLLLCQCHLDRDMDSDPATVARYVCMGCQSSGHGVKFFPNYKAAACHWARSPTCNQSGRSIRVVGIESKPGDRDVGGSGAAGTWKPRNPAAKGANRTPVTYQIRYITPPLHSTL